jgi:pyruvate/2-oxoglutarate dehydrogenase complex dihydrolipoamide dehydrogenase (E3) component
MAEPDFDVFIIGGGQAGPPLARELAQTGTRLGLAEREHLGGSCVNFGCTPTKAAIASARVAHLARRGSDYGLRIPTVEVNFPAVIERARKIAMTSRSALDRRMEGSENPKLFRGHAKLDGREGEAFRIRIGSEQTMARQVVLDTGTRSTIPPIPGLEDIKYIHAGNWLDLATLPKHLAMIGGGGIGLEMAQFYRRMGSEVTVIEASEHIAGREDADVAHALLTLLEADGIQFKLKTAVASIDADRDRLTVRLGANGSSSLQASHVFVATGRHPNTDDLGLETVGVRTTKQGIIEVDERLATNVKGIWAAGDIRGGPQFTHTAWDDYRVLMSQLRGDGSHTTRRVVPYAIFTDPELGRVGMTEAQARDAGHSVKVGRFDISDSGKAYEIGEDKGMIKVIVDARSNLILGAAVLAVDGAELVQDYIALMNAKAPYTVIRDAVYIHPTLAEDVQSAVSEI